MHVSAAPPGTHPIGNYRVQIDPHSGHYRIHVQCAGQWHTVSPQNDNDSRTLITLLQSPFAAVQDGWIVGSRSP